MQSGRTRRSPVSNADPARRIITAETTPAAARPWYGSPCGVVTVFDEKRRFSSALTQPVSSKVNAWSNRGDA